MRTGPSVSQEPQIGVGGWSAGEREHEYVQEVLRSGRLTYGPFSRRFEQAVADAHARRFALFCNSGTSALQVALHALKRRHGWKDGDEVVVPALTFVATVNVVLQNGLRPVFVDVDPEHFDLDPALLEERIGPRTRAVMPVHVCGQPADMEPIMEIAGRRALHVLEDACEAMFVSYRGRPVGSFGEAACFSTYVAHVITTGVGGLAACDDPELATAIRSLFNHGRDGIYLAMDDDDTADPERVREIMTRRFSFVDVGYSYRATELEAALGLAQVERRDAVLARRRANAERLTAGLSDLADILALPAPRPGSGHAWMMYPIVVRDPAVDRDDLLVHLESRRVETRYLLPLLNQPVYRRLFGDLEPDHPVAAGLNRRAFYVGCHPGIGKAELERMVTAFRSYFGRV